MEKLLMREEFRRAVFERDGHKCVMCGMAAVDAHHIIDRSLFPDGGYYLGNGASLCERHHMDAERTTILPAELYARCAIEIPVLPPHLNNDTPYDKWGNAILPNGLRMRGEMFQEAGVQKMLEEGGFIDDFTWLVKYPRTYHLPWSMGRTNDDRVVESLSGLEGEDVVVSVKMDGECSTFYTDYVHARSTDYKRHPSRDWVKNFHASIAHEIPAGFRVCGENTYAAHSIAYSNLADYFLGFSMWNDRNFCLSWDDTLEWFELLGITHVPVLYRGVFDEKIIRSLQRDMHDGDPCEGYVVRRTDSFHYKDFRRYVAKFVRANHVQTSKHWLYGQEVVPNKRSPR